MSDVNKVILLGRFGGPPEMRQTDGGRRSAKLQFVTSRQWTNAAGKQESKDQWHQVVAWNGPARGPQLADIAERMVAKGVTAYVEGRLEYRSYYKDSVEIFVSEVVASEIVYLGQRVEAP